MNAVLCNHSVVEFYYVFFCFYSSIHLDLPTMTAFYLMLILELPWFCYLKTLFSMVDLVVECMYVQSLCIMYCK